MKLYIRQAWAMLKQNKLFSVIYISGTALAIATTMVMAIVYYVKIAPIYPEVNRGKTYYVTSLTSQDKKNVNQMQTWKVSYRALQEWFYPLKNVEAVSATYDVSWGMANNFVRADGSKEDLPVIVRPTDTGMFRIYDFHFVEGKPFSQADMESGIRSAVITTQLARYLYGMEEGVVGKAFRLNGKEHRVTGVVQGASYLSRHSFAQIYVPYSTINGYNQSNNRPQFLGTYNVTLMVKSDEQLTALRAELDECIRKFNVGSDEFEITMGNQPTSHFWQVFYDDKQYIVEKDTSLAFLVKECLVVFLVLLLVPALNLSAMISGRMETRLSEMGVRKSFGASRGVLLRQVLSENLVLTFLGGAIGLVLAWLALVVGREFIFSMFEASFTERLGYLEVDLTGEMLLAPAIFVGAFLSIVMLNLMSALVPAYLSLRHPIIESLNEKR